MLLVNERLTNNDDDSNDHPYFMWSLRDGIGSYVKHVVCHLKTPTTE